MFEVTALAQSNLKSYMEENKITSALRVALMQGGCSGPALALALDDSTAQDKVFKEDGLTFLVDQELLQQCGSIKIDFVDAGYRSGFSITSANPVGGGGACSSCGGTCP
ncbi:MAG: IscA/HesB family protein [Desulfobulbus sp.]|jgi:iron-sulfur cluster assembly protein